MPSIIPGYEYDIFISYRQNDNKQDGWVTEFVNTLKNELEATIKDKLSVYFDENPHDGLHEHHEVDDSLAKKLKCLIFIPIISKTYCDPNSFAWTNEFLKFNQLASNDEYGLKVTLPNGNTASRVLPIRIHDIDDADKQLVENEIGILRSIDFVYQSSGVNRPLSPSDERELNVHKTIYRDQINKVANAIQEITTGIKTAEATEESDAEETEKPQPKKIQLTSEIKRRNVLRTSLVYILTALVFWKVADISIGLLNLPENTLQFITLALIVFFPIAMLMAWLYERSPQGFIKTGSAASRDNPFTDAQKKPLTSNTFILLLVVTIVALFFIYPQSSIQPASDVEEIGASIAVLAFDDQSPDGDQEWLGDGIADEILNVLAQAKGLKVSGKTSSFSFKGKNATTKEIGEALDVKTVLEGSVSRVGDKLRITAQLIDVETEAHIWSDKYDRDAEDIFAIVDEVAQSIVGSLMSELSVEEVGKFKMLYQPNSEAYEYLLKAENIHIDFSLTRNNELFLMAKELYQKAINIDHEYIDAFAGFANLYDTRGWQKGTRDIDHPKRDSILNIAYQSDPKSPYVLYLKGYVHRNLDSAFNFFKKAYDLDPYNQGARLLINKISNLGFHDMCISLCKRYLARDPLNKSLQRHLVNSLWRNGQVEDARKIIIKSLDFDNDFQIIEFSN